MRKPSTIKAKVMLGKAITVLYSNLAQVKVCGNTKYASSTATPEKAHEHTFFSILNYN